ncbi:MAG: rhodanese-like domain-containing protein [Bacteroidota bacterium]
MAKEKTLNHMSLLAFTFVAVVVIVNLFTTNNYGRANREVVETIVNENNLFDYHQLKNLTDGDLEGYILIDLRSPQQYEEGHLPAAISIPFEALLDRNNINKLKELEGKKPVLYGDSESQAHTARVMLLSKGLEKDVMVMGGSYSTALKYAIEDFDPAYAGYKEDKARFDFPRFMGTVAPREKDSKPAGIIPAVQTETLGAQGGC